MIVALSRRSKRNGKQSRWTLHHEVESAPPTLPSNADSEASGCSVDSTRPSIRSLPGVGHIEWQPDARPSQHFAVVGPTVAKCGRLSEAERLAAKAVTK